jgi:hypothetical protein
MGGQDGVSRKTTDDDPPDLDELYNPAMMGAAPPICGFRVPLQILFIVWTYYFAIAKDLPF